MVNTVLSLLKHNGYATLADSVRQQLPSHPAYPQLRAITDTLDTLEIENLTVTLPKEAISELPEVFVAEIGGREGTDLVFLQRTAEGFMLESEQGMKKKVSLADLEVLMTGVVLMVEANDASPKPTAAKGSPLPLLLVGVTIALLFLNPAYPQTLIPLVYLGLTLLGGFFAILVAQQAHEETSNGLASSVCKGLGGQKNSCQKVIISGKGSLLRGVSLSDLPVVYFGALLLLLPLAGFDPNYLYLLSLGSLPLVLLSWIIQGRGLKSWCTLCLLLSGVLLAQFGVLHFAKPTFTFSFEYGTQLIVVTLVAGLIWRSFRRFWHLSRQAEQHALDLMRFKRNPLVVGTLLEHQPAAALDTLPGALAFTQNPEAPIKVTTVLNPECAYCAEHFSEYEQLLTFPEVTWHIVFNMWEGQSSEMYQVAGAILSTYPRDPKEALLALKAWFARPEFAAWNAPSVADTEQAQATLKAQKEWCMAQELTDVPTILINGRVLPAPFTSADLPTLMDVLRQQVPEIE